MSVRPYQQPGSPYWSIRYTPAPGQPRKCETTGISHHGKKKPPIAVLEICRALEERLAKAKFGLSPELVQKTIAAFIPEYIGSLVGMAPTTISGRESNLNCWAAWCKDQGIEQMTQITTQNAIQYVDHLKATCALTTVSTRVNSLRVAMDEARLRQYILIDNPFAITIHRAKAKARDAWTLAEIRSLLAIDEPLYLKTAIRVSLYTGCRSGSINALLWKDVDFEGNVMDFTRSKTGEYAVALHPSLESYLLSLWESVKPQPADPIVPELAGRSSSYLANAFHAARTASGVSRGTFHWFRHLLPQALEAVGVPQDVRMKILNHKSEPTHRHYLHIEAGKALEYLSRVKFE